MRVTTHPSDDWPWRGIEAHGDLGNPPQKPLCCGIPGAFSTLIGSESYGRKMFKGEAAFQKWKSINRAHHRCSASLTHISAEEHDN